MDGKYMKVKRIIIPTITMVLIASQLFGCAATNREEAYNMLQETDQIELEMAVPIDQEEEQGTQSAITWEVLAELKTYQDTLRTPMEDALGITIDSEMYWIKHGMLYQDNQGNDIQNNTLKGALQNKDFRKAVDNDEIITKLADAAFNTFIDLEEDEEKTNFYMAINAYFNLLPTTEEGYANPQSMLTRAEFMSLVMRAETECHPGVYALDEFTAAVGESEYNPYAQYVADDCYITTADKSLNDQTYNSGISRAEAIYMLMNHYYADEFKSIDTSKASLDDVKDGGDIAATQGYTDQAKAKELSYCITNPDAGVPTDIYKALVLAESKGLIDSETCFDEAITLEESIELLINIYKSIPLDDTTTGSVVLEVEVPVGGMMTENGYHWDTTWAERDEDRKDGWVGGEVHYYEDGTTYLIWADGRRIELYEEDPTGLLYTGVTEADAAKVAEIERELFN